MKASCGEDGAKARHLRVWHRNVEVVVRSRLLAEYGINHPAIVNVHLQATRFQECTEVGGILLEHNRSVAIVLPGSDRSSRVP